MLKAMRHNAKYFYVLFFIVILSFIFWGVGTVDKSDQRDIVAEVGPYKVTAQDFWQTYDRVFKRYREIYKDKFDEAMQEKLNLKENVLNSLVEDKVLLTVAKRNGVTVSDAELNEAIKNEPAFMQNGAFDTRVYQNRLRLSRLTPEVYEAEKKQELIVDKMRRLIELSVNVPADLPDARSADEKTAKAMKDAMLMNARMNAVRAYVNGVSKDMKIKIYSDRIA
jgi:parvulin-like peptidyl-prolyl isomerase